RFEDGFHLSCGFVVSTDKFHTEPSAATDKRVRILHAEPGALFFAVLARTYSSFARRKIPIEARASKIVLPARPIFGQRGTACTGLPCRRASRQKRLRTVRKRTGPPLL